jgi:hypothetical protein
MSEFRKRLELRIDWGKVNGLESERASKLSMRKQASKLAGDKWKINEQANKPKTCKQVIGKRVANQPKKQYSKNVSKQSSELQARTRARKQGAAPKKLAI